MSSLLESSSTAARRSRRNSRSTSSSSAARGRSPALPLVPSPQPESSSSAARRSRRNSRSASNSASSVARARSPRLAMAPSPPQPESRSAASRRSRRDSQSASASSSSPVRSRSPSPEPITVVYPAYLPPGGRSGIAAHRFQPELPVHLVDRGDFYEALVQLPGLMRSLILRFRMRRIQGVTGLQLHGRVGLSRSMGGAPTVHRAGARRLYSGGEFQMRFNFPVAVNRCVMTMYDLTRSVVLFNCVKAPPNNHQPQPADDYASGWLEVSFGDNDGI